MFIYPSLPDMMYTIHLEKVILRVWLVSKTTNDQNFVEMWKIPTCLLFFFSF